MPMEYAGQPVEHIQWNGTEVMGTPKPIDLGKGTSFNIKKLAPNVDFGKLTIDNFYLKGIVDINAQGYHAYKTYGDNPTYKKVIETKTYNKAKGELTWYIKTSFEIKGNVLFNETVSVECVLIP